MQQLGVSGKAMRELAEVNHAFLTLLVMSPVFEENRDLFGLDPDTVRRIRLLEEENLVRMGSGPFPLFSLRFHDLPGWGALLGSGVCEDACAPTWPAECGRVHQFMVMALAAIRSVAGREPVSASILFGAPAELVTQLSAAEIRSLPAIAEAASPWLRARCAAMTNWWDGLIVSACRAEEYGPETHRGIHSSLVSALDLRRARLPEGRLYRRR